jgi:hypothetical protein
MRSGCACVHANECVRIHRTVLTCGARALYGVRFRDVLLFKKNGVIGVCMGGRKRVKERVVVIGVCMGGRKGVKD